MSEGRQRKKRETAGATPAERKRPGDKKDGARGQQRDKAKPDENDPKAERGRERSAPAERRNRKPTDASGGSARRDRAGTDASRQDRRGRRNKANESPGGDESEVPTEAAASGSAALPQSTSATSRAASKAPIADEAQSAASIGRSKSAVPAAQSKSKVKASDSKTSKGSAKSADAGGKPDPMSPDFNFQLPEGFKGILKYLMYDLHVTRPADVERFCFDWCKSRAQEEEKGETTRFFKKNVQ